MTGLYVYILIRTQSSYLDFKLSVARSSQWKCEIAGGAMPRAVMLRCGDYRDNVGITCRNYRTYENYRTLLENLLPIHTTPAPSRAHA